MSQCLLTSNAEAASGLTAKIQPLTLRPRSDAPMMVDLVAAWDGKQPLEGQMRLELSDGHMRLYDYRTSDIVIAPGKQTMRLMLPAVTTTNQQLGVDIRFVGKNGVVDLGRDSFVVISPTERSFLICMSDPWSRPDSPCADIARSLRFERFEPPNDAPVRSVLTPVQHLPPEDLPPSAMGYAPYDIMFVAEEGFSLLKEKQLDAIARWVEAGGSVCAIPAGGGLKPHHIDFLNKLAGQLSPAFVATSDGGVQPVEKLSSTGIGMYRCGLGRAVIAPRMPDADKDLDTPAWRAAVAHLWRVRAAQQKSVVDKGVWLTDQQKDASNDYRYLNPRAGGLRPGSGSGPAAPPAIVMRPRPLNAAVELSSSLSPKAVRLMPFWLLVVILVAFLIAIGPVDYFVLGFLKRRKLTWVTFPAMAVAATVVIMQLSEHYMGGIDYRTRLTIVDLGQDNTVLRETCCEGVFTARQKIVSTELHNALFGPLTDPYRTAYYRPGMRGLDNTPVFTGRIPGGFVVSQRAEQWALRCNRITSLAPTDKSTAPPAPGSTVGKPLALNWSSITWSDLTPRARSVRSKLIGEKEFPGFVGSIFVLNRYDMRSLYSRLPDSNRTYHDSEGPVEPPGGILPGGILREMSVRPQVGLFSIVSQISPNGAANAEDLSLLDPTDANQALLVVIVPKGDDFIAYRRLYYGDGK